MSDILDFLKRTASLLTIDVSPVKIDLVKIERLIHIEVHEGEKYKEVGCKVRYSWSSNEGELRFVTRRGRTVVGPFPIQLPDSIWKERNGYVLGNSYIEGLKQIFQEKGISGAIPDEVYRRQEEMRSIIRSTHEHRLRDLMYQTIFGILKYNRIKKAKMIWLGDLDLHTEG